jgi:hypothetical protein
MSRLIALLRRNVVPAGLVLAAWAAPLDAQMVNPPPFGSRLRVWSQTLPDRNAIGELVDLDSARLLLQRSWSRVNVPWALVDSLQVSRGMHGGGGRRGALRGALFGGVVLAIFAGGSAEEGEVIDPAAVAVLGFVAGAVGGAIIGGVIGSARDKERWESVPLRPRVGAQDRSAPRPTRVALVRFRVR